MFISIKMVMSASDKTRSDRTLPLFEINRRGTAVTKVLLSLLIYCQLIVTHPVCLETLFESALSHQPN